jgi:hypothetical protein
MKNILLMLLLSISFGVFAEEDAINPQDLLPEYYPKYSIDRGRINEINYREDIFKLNGVLFNLNDTVKVYFTSTKNGNLTMLREGQSILYELNSDNEITQIWVLPKELFIPAS